MFVYMDRVLAQFEEVAPAVTATPGAAAWTARETGTERRVLVKRLPGDDARVRATQALTLHNPRIVPTRRWLRDGEAFYVVRDFVPGINVRQALTTVTQYAYERLQALFLPLLDALEYAHGRGLTHGGITPENVLLTGDDGTGPTVLTDWATSLVTPKDYEIPPTPRTDYVALCELYKEFLPKAGPEDEAGQTARARLLRNLIETQRTVQTAQELRYKLDAVARMAVLLDFPQFTPRNGNTRQGARLVIAVSPPAAALNPGGGATLSLSLRNNGDTLLHVEALESNAVWLNPAAWATPVDLMPDHGRDVPLTVSAARLTPGNYQAQVTVLSNSGLGMLKPALGASWNEQSVTVPVVVQGTETSQDPPLSQDSGTKGRTESVGIACTQEPDPGLVRYGQNGVLHLGVQNVGPRRLRLDKLKTNPAWLVYPGEWQPLWIEPGATQYLGFSVQAQSLAGGDYTAHVTLLTSHEEPTLLGSQLAWREMGCDVRVRVVRGASDVREPEKIGLGCLPVLLALGASFCGLLALWSVR
jgi:hypothetical protein